MALGFEIVPENISIHTPAWGVTWQTADHGAIGHFISIHTPAWGVTRLDRQIPIGGKYFNPHSRVGSDPRMFSSAGPPLYFNPHSRVGSDAGARGRFGDRL